MSGVNGSASRLERGSVVLAAAFAAMLGASVAAEAQTGLLVASPFGGQPVQLTGALGVEGQHQRYNEPSLGVTEKGWFGGVTLNGQAQAGLWQLRGDLRFDGGSMDYSGSGTVNGISDFVFEGRIMIARVLPIGGLGIDHVTPYVGYGYRRLEDNLGGKTTSTGAAGYDRLSQYNYLPLGIEALTASWNGWALKPTAEYDVFLSGTEDSNLTQVSPAYSNLHNTQSGGYGVRGALMLATNWAGHPIEIGPYLRYWHIDQSNVAPYLLRRGVTVRSGYEPDNHTTELGLGAKIWF